MTHGKLTQERNIFIVFFVLALVCSAFFNHLRMQNILNIDENFQVSVFHGYTIILTFLKGVIIYVVYRLSRFLKVSTGVTVVYCMLAPLSLVQVIPFIILLKKVKSTRIGISASSETITPDVNSSG